MQTEGEVWVGAKQSLDLRMDLPSLPRTRSHRASVCCVCVCVCLRCLSSANAGKGRDRYPVLTFTLTPLPLVPINSDANLYATRHPALGQVGTLPRHPLPRLSPSLTANVNITLRPSTV